MQTFIPYPNFVQSARSLDYKRLGKQRVETLQILNALAGKTRGWVNHPATKMWRGYEQALCLYGLAVTQEWRNRGYKDTCQQQIQEYARHFDGKIVLPAWWGNQNIHDSHKSKLLQKDYAWYSQFGWDVPLNLEYVWPV